jgi:hypothetical protein
MPRRFPQCIASVAYRNHRVTVRLEAHGQRFADVRFIIHDEYLQGGWDCRIGVGHGASGL